MADQKENLLRLSRVLQGDIRDLPPINSQIIRIFTSSTFTDTMRERNSLIEKVYPKIQQHCRSKYGLEFQVVDMRWGVTDDVTDDHQTATLCLQEIENCQKLSAGPNFVTFLGQRHGSQPFPTEIGKDEFDILLETLVAMETDVEMLKKWFLLDENSLPPVYILQPISSRIPHFLSEDEIKKKDARKEWNEAFVRLQMLLRKAAKVCADRRSLSEEVTSKYFKSVTEREIDQGIFNSPGDPNRRCLCFIRIIEDIMHHLTNEKAARFIDMLESGLDEEAQDHLTRLRDQRLANAVTTLHRFKVMWKDVVDNSPRSPSDYIEKFTDLFERTVIDMIDRSITFNQDLNQDKLHIEVLHHLHMVKDRCAIFHGREDVLENIKNSVKLGLPHPTIVFGHSGCGKTSIIAKCVEQVQHWLPGHPSSVIIITRMLGTTAMSTNILQVLTSICSQIAVCYNIQDVEITDEISGLSQTLIELMAHASKEKPLCLILDSLDQLSAKEGAYRLNWLPRRLPENVYLIMSTLPEMHCLLDTLRKRHPSGSFIEIPPLGGDTSQQILNSWLAAHNKKLSDEQARKVQDIFRECSLALYVKLVFDEVLTWHSYTQVSDLQIQTTIREVICQLFRKLQKKFGATFVNHALGYISASRSGISETELEDVLSLDDVVLTDVFQYHVPPIRRIPQLLWLRLKNDISSYLVNREADGARVIYWYHRQFIEAAQDFFLKSETALKYLHQNMAEYYLGKWCNKAKPFTYNEYQMKKLNLKSQESKCDRKVAHQPLVFTSFDAEGRKTIYYNTRKLNKLPYHLHHMGEDEILRQECLYSYRWLMEKIKATSVQAVLSDFDLLRNKTESDTYLSTVLRTSKATLNAEPRTLAIEIIGSLLSYGYLSEDLSKLLDTCFKEGPLSNAVLPRKQCYNAPGGPCIYMLEHAALPARQRALVVASDPALLGALTRSTNTLLLWDVEEGELVQEVSLWQEEEPKFNVLNWSSSESKFLCACAFQSNVNPVVLYNAKTEELTVVLLDKCYPKVGFIDNFALDLKGDKIIICILGKECDIFDLCGKLLYSTNVQPISMHINSDDLFLPSKTEPLIMQFDLAKLDESKPTEIKITSIAKQVALTTEGDILVLYGDQDALDWIKKLRIHDQIIPVLKKPAQILEFKLIGEYILFLTTAGVVWWKISNKKVIHELLIPEKVVPSDRRVTPLTAHVTSKLNLVFCAYDGYIIVWDLVHGRLRQTIKASPVPLTDFLIQHSGGTNFSSDALITATSYYRTIQIWDANQADLRNFHAVALDNAGCYISLAQDTKTAVLRGRFVRETKIVSLETCSIVCSMAENQDSTDPTITSDGKFIVVRHYGKEQSMQHGREQTIGIYSNEGKVLHTIRGLSIYFSGYSIEGSNRLMVTHEEISPTEGIQTRVWDLTKGSVRQTIEAYSGGIRSVFFAKNDTLLLTHQLRPFTQLNQDTVAHVYSVESGKELFTMSGFLPDSNIYPVPKSDNAIGVMSKGPDEEMNSFVVFNVSNGEIVSKHQSIITKKFRMSRDGRTAVDSRLRVFDIYTGDILHDLNDKVSPLPILSIQLAPRVTSDGKYMVWVEISAGLVKVLRIADGKIIVVGYTHSQPASMAVSDDNLIVLSLYDGRIMFLEVLDSEDDCFDTNLSDLMNFALKPSTQASHLPYRVARLSSKDTKRSGVCSVL